MDVKAKAKTPKNKKPVTPAIPVTESAPLATQEPTRLQPTPIPSAGFKTGVVHQASAAQMIPPVIAQRFKVLAANYGLELDLGNVSLADVTPDAIKAFRAKIELLAANAKLLPELMKLTKKLINADIQLAEFHRDLVKVSNEHQIKLDKATADIWLSMAGYGSKSGKLEHRTNVRSQLTQKQDELYSQYYQDSVYGKELQILDTQFKIKTSNQQILAAGRTQKMELNGQSFEARQKRKQELDAYIASATA